MIVSVAAVAADPALSPDRLVCLWFGRQCRNAFPRRCVRVSLKEASVKYLIPENKR